MNKNDNPYKVLELTTSATEAEIKKAYRQLARKFHPDKQKTDEERHTATQQFARISDAYDLLNDPVRRYDWRMKHESSQPRSSTTSTSTKAATQSTPSTAKKTGSGTSTTRVRTPPSATKTSPAVPPTRSTRASFAAGPSPNVGRRPRSAGPGGARRATTGGMAPRRGSVGSNMSAAAATAKRVSSPGPGQFHRRAVADNIPRRSMAGASPIRIQSPMTGGRKKNRDASNTRKPKQRASLSSDASVGGMRRPKSSPNMAGLNGSEHSSMSVRRRPGLDFRSDHGVRRVPRRTSVDAASVASAASAARTMRRPSSRESLNSVNTTQTRTMRRPSSRESLNSVSTMKSCKSEPGIRMKKKKGILSGVSLRGSTANMRNATFDDSPDGLSTKNTLSRKILRMKPLSSRA